MLLSGNLRWALTGKSRCRHTATEPKPRVLGWRNQTQRSALAATKLKAHSSWDIIQPCWAWQCSWAEPQCLPMVLLLSQAQKHLAPHTSPNWTLTGKQSQRKHHWRQMAITGYAMIPAQYFSLPKDIKPVLAEQVPTKRFSGFGEIPSNLSEQLLVPRVIRTGEWQTEQLGTGAMSDLHHPEKKEKGILCCKLCRQTGSLHVSHTGQVQTQKLTDVQQKVLSLNYHGNPIVSAST